MTSASGAWPSVISVTISRLSRYSVSGCSPAMAVGTISPRSLYASTSKVAGRAAFVSVGLATDVGHLYFFVFCCLFGSEFGVAVGAALPYRRHLVTDLVVRSAAAQQRLQVVSRLGEEAGIERALGRQAHACARRAERLRHRGDDADFAAAVDVAPALGDFAGVVGADRLELPALADAADHLGGGNNVIHPPAVGAADIHELDEAHDVTGAAPALGHLQDAVVIHAALHHHVDLDRLQAGRRRGLDALDHLRHRKVGIVHGAEGGVIQRVETHRDALQAGFLQRYSMLGK